MKKRREIHCSYEGPGASSIVIQVVLDCDLGHDRFRDSNPIPAVIFVPLPFVVALLLLILLVTLWRNSDRVSVNRPFLALIGLCCLQSIVLGLRWGYGVEEMRFILPVMGGCLPPLVLASFHGLIDHDSTWERDMWLQALPPVVIVALVFFAPNLIDFALILLFVGYAIALLRLGRAGPDGLDGARFDGVVAAHKALIIAAASLCLSAVFDLVVRLDFEWKQGTSVPLIVTNANLLWLLALGLAAIVAARARALPEPGAEAERSSPTAAQDREVLDRVDRLLVEHRLFLDENLTLSRLARRAGMPARQISGAVNRLAGKNVSQYINDFRIAEACRLLRQDNSSVTAAMFESGFQTKSNFNREFRRVTSLSPATWRDRNRAA